MEPINISETNALTFDDLQNEYNKLFCNYRNLTKTHENDLQQIYELQRNVKLSKAAEEHLAQELEIISSSQNASLEKSNKKLNQEVEELKRRVIDLEEYIEILEKKLENSNSENNKLQEQLCEISASVGNDSFTKTNKFCLEQQDKYEIENLNLLAKLNEAEDRNQKSFKNMAEKERHIEVLKEEIQCYKENLSAKRSELEEKTILLESLQERLSELNTEIASLKLQQGNENVKGNSLFAEVDDQRQEMKNKLLSQKKCYLEMKKAYNESQFEIRRLKRENCAMQTEVQACVSIFVNSKKFYEDKLVERISFLSKQNDELERKLNISQDRLLSLAEKNEITWLDSMMTFCKNETTELKRQLQNIRLQKGIIEKNYRDSQAELSKWRFEALKLRCILIDRESLLEQNLIKFQDSHQMNIEIKEDISKSFPQILSDKNEVSNGMKKEISELEIHQNEKCNNSHIDCLNTSSQNEFSVQSVSKPVPKILNDSQANNKNEICTTEEFFEESLKLESPKIFETKKTNSNLISSTEKNESFKYFDNSKDTEGKLHYCKDNSKKITEEDKENNLVPANKFHPFLSNNQNEFDRKSVKFSSEINCKVDNKNSKTMKIISKQTKSNILIKKIIIKSKDDKS